MSPTPSPELPRSRFNYSTLRYGTYTHPGLSQSHRVGSMLDRSFGCDSFRRYAFSEAARVTRPHVSTAAHGSFRRRSFRQTAAPQPVFANAVFQQNGDYGSRWNHNQAVVKQEQHTVQGASGDMMLGGVQPDDSLSWLAQVRREGQGLRRLNSYPPSVVSLEVDIGRQMDVELPIQQIQAQNVMTM